MTTRLRMLVGSAALVAGLWFLSGAAAAPVLPADAYKKAAEADVAQLQKHIETCLSDAKEARRYGPTARTMAAVLAVYGEATGDTALKDAALKVAEELGKKDFKAAAASAKGLAVKGGGKALPPGMAHAKAKLTLDEVMSPFRGSKVGGLNLEKDIRDLAKPGAMIDPAAVSLLAARVAVLGEFTEALPNDKANINAGNKAKWAKWSKDMTDVSKKLTEEAAKGKGADTKEIVKLLKGLDAKCSDCHNEFRD